LTPALLSEDLSDGFERLLVVLQPQPLLLRRV